MSADLLAEFSQDRSEAQAPAKADLGADAPTTTDHPKPQRPYELGRSTTSWPMNPAVQSLAPPGGTPHGLSEISFPMSASSSSAQAAAEDDDGWGDFETAEPATETIAAVPARKGAQNPLPSSKRLIRAPTIDLMTNKLVDVGITSPLEQTQPRDQVQKPSKHGPSIATASRDENVLFDAEDFELSHEDEETGSDFDDFESFIEFPVPSRASGTDPATNLLELDGPSSPSRRGDAHRDDVKGRAEAPRLAPSQSRPASSPSEPGLHLPTNVSRQIGTGNDPSKNGEPEPPSLPRSSISFGPGLSAVDGLNQDWEPWEDNEDVGILKKDVEQHPDGWNGMTWSTVQPTIEEKLSPPGNVPPPSVLLAVFPELFDSGKAILNPVAGHDSLSKQQLLANPRASQFLQGFLLLGTVAARIIAGRKHRWHRDKILAKSMTISAAGSKGMKLAGIDRKQSVREDREAADVTAAWQVHVGRLRTAVSIINTNEHSRLRVPELNEKMAVQTAKSVPQAPKACVICGLKREERVACVDFDVEDSFGEWWTEHWGHRACRNFWVQHEHRLRQR